MHPRDKVLREKVRQRGQILSVLHLDEVKNSAKLTDGRQTSEQ